jgi:hypothetical protein
MDTDGITFVENQELAYHLNLLTIYQSINLANAKCIELFL